MLKEDKTKEREERHKVTQEDFTPHEIVEMMLDKLPEETFTKMEKKILDPSCGIGNFLTEALKRKLSNSTCKEDSIKALRSIYGVEIMADNIEECRNRLYEIFKNKHPEISDDDFFNYRVRSIIRCHIVWYDSLQFNFDKGWGHESSYRPGDHENITFSERKGKHKNFPMWSLEKIKPQTKLDLFDIPFEPFF